jgi:lambda repressor-like predicted transcriptional regulator
MNDHRGQIVEYIVRKNGYSLTDLGKTLNVNRRTLYNWFKQPLLQSDRILRIGIIIRHDFSIEFPDLFNSEDFTVTPKSNFPDQVSTDVNWQNKYLGLLEEYRKHLERELKKVTVAN